ncbi:helix-turn-helix transcriptional regulator [Pontibaca methylaminivorans]|uniref:mRNA interferase RelE/StbE n=1 Tax=Pontibaca methylaminivorans TaxID=515897 RepID=A0A1R3WBL8_9RHOB|nr:helix-turn-helix transcriptional regulator [Pontibaca methylaminivorans]SIT74722.1 mRNA interferase RelE/StbE [Pontibaca methylaminivorans]
MNEMVTITREEYDRLLEAAEDLADIEAYDRAKAQGGDSIPDEYVGRILDGESPLRVFRDWRGLTQARLAELSGVNRVQIANIEGGSRTGSVETLKKLAEALGLGVDDLI